MSDAQRPGATEGVRLFDNPLLERLSHSHPLTVPAFWLPTLSSCLIAGWIQARANGAELVVLLAGCFLSWTLAEYLLHRFVFHLSDLWPVAWRLSFVLHGGHHRDPVDKTRHVMPVIVMIPVFLVFIATLVQIFPMPYALIVGSGFGFSYVIYDMTHAACHQLPMNNRLGRLLKAHHLHHHFCDSGSNFAVTFPLWDRIFRTDSRL
jgi:dihydroceramide fatty acyl 2-hydroxylase